MFKNFLDGTVRSPTRNLPAKNEIGGSQSYALAWNTNGRGLEEPRKKSNDNYRQIRKRSGTSERESVKSTRLNLPDDET